MLEAAETLRIQFGTRPLLLWILVLGFLFVVSRTRPRHAATGPGAARTERLVAVCALLGLLFYPAVAIWYATDVHFFDYAEPSMPAVGWLFHVGQAVYHSPDSAERYAHIYGPLAFVFHGVALAWLGPSIGVAKGLGAAAGITALALLFCVIRRHGSTSRAAVLVGLSALLLLTFRNYSFWTRPEPLLLLCVSAALFSAVLVRGHGSSILVGIALGILWNLKFTGPLYSLPVLAVLHQRAGRRAWTLATGVAIVTAVLPFVFFPNVSFTNYVAWVRLSSGTGLSLSILKQNVEWAAFLSIPLGLLWYAALDERRASPSDARSVPIALLAGTCGVMIAAAKPGAGAYHLLPFVPLVTYVVSQQMANLPPSARTHRVVQIGVTAFVLVLAITATVQQAQFVTTMAARRNLHEAEDILTAMDAYAGVVEVGYGTSEILTLTRPILVFRNNSYLLDQPAVREHQLAGLDVPDATVDALRRCRVDYWLIPKGEAPFGGVNGYPRVLWRPLYPQKLRDAFEATHTRVAATAYFDVWRCQP